MDPHNHPGSQGYHDGQWVDLGGSHSHHQSPVHEFTGFQFTTPPLPLGPHYAQPPRTTHQQLQPLVTPQWPSMLTSQSMYAQPIVPSAPPSAQHPQHSTQQSPHGSMTAISPLSATAITPTTRTGSTPRRTLTDADRRRMCQYHEQHPTTKQTEIGALFGVERSTVSKVLRNKEKYLCQEDGSRSPIKRTKGKFPDIERALSNWARNLEKQGHPLSDGLIRDKALLFASTASGSDAQSKINSNTWLEKFKLKNGLMGAKLRKGSIAESEHSNPGSEHQTPSGTSPVSPAALASPSLEALATKQDPEGKMEPSEDYFDFSATTHRPLHSQSNTSLSSAFTDAASSFSAGPTSPTSPFFSSDSAFANSPFLHSATVHSSTVAGSSDQFRPRGHNLPMLATEPYISPPSTSEALTPKYVNVSTLESPLEEMHRRTDDRHPTGGRSQSHSPGSMPPPPPPGLLTNAATLAQGHPATPVETPVTPALSVSSPTTPSHDDARRALEVVMDFFKHQPSGFVEPQDYLTIGRLMEKLKLQRGSPTQYAAHVHQELPGGMHPMPKREVAGFVSQA